MVEESIVESSLEVNEQQSLTKPEAKPQNISKAFAKLGRGIGGLGRAHQNLKSAEDEFIGDSIVGDGDSQLSGRKPNFNS